MSLVNNQVFLGLAKECTRHDDLREFHFRFLSRTVKVIKSLAIKSRLKMHSFINIGCIKKNLNIHVIMHITYQMIDMAWKSLQLLF